MTKKKSASTKSNKKLKSRTGLVAGEDKDAVITRTGNKRRVIRTQTKSGQPTDQNAKIDGDVNDPIVEALLRPKRIYRKSGSEELKDVNRKPTDEVNKLTKKLTPRVSDDHVKLFNKCVERSESGRKALERAVELLADELGLEKL